jgi:hypothetical protein
MDKRLPQWILLFTFQFSGNLEDGTRALDQGNGALQLNDAPSYYKLESAKGWW